MPNIKGKGKQEGLERLPLEIQESLVLEDLLFVLMVRLFARRHHPVTDASIATLSHYKA